VPAEVPKRAEELEVETAGIVLVPGVLYNSDDEVDVVVPDDPLWLE